jgi:hypothetical protein
LGGLPVLVTLTVLGAAVVHASWNAIAHRIKDKMVGFALDRGALRTLVDLGGEALAKMDGYADR